MNLSMKQRESNIELLRIIAMFLVLLVHADFWALGAPTVEDCVESTLDASLRVFFEQLSIASVNIFVCISGWFGIKASFKGLANFLFQCLLWLTIIYLATVALGLAPISISGLKSCIFATENGWFIKAYLMLYILSPVLNAYVNSAEKKQYKILLILFFVFEIVYGRIFPTATKDIVGGYSTISFIGLYLLMRYLRRFEPSFTNWNRKVYGFTMIGIIIFFTLAYIIPPLVGINTTKFGAMAIGYLSPSCIIIAVFSVLYFSKIKLENKFINWCASSSFAVYLFHNVNVTMREGFKSSINLLHNTFSSPLLFWAIVILYLLVIYFFATLLDKGRIALWNKIWPFFERPLSKDK